MFATKNILNLAELVLKNAENNDFSLLNEAHIITSLVKAISTKETLSGIEILRRAAGGHGFSAYSALPGLQMEVTPTYTFEGKSYNI